MTNKKAATIALVVLVALLVATIPAIADGLVSIQTGARSVTAYDVDFGSWPFDFADRQTGGIKSATPWNVVDTSGTTVPWEVYVAATDFTDGSDSIPVTLADQTVHVNNQTADISCVMGACTPGFEPISTALNGPTAYLDNAAPLRILRSDNVDIEIGSYDFEPAYDLKIPGGLLPGDYTSTWTVTIVDAP